MPLLITLRRLLVGRSGFVVAEGELEWGAAATLALVVGGAHANVVFLCLVCVLIGADAVTIAREDTCCANGTEDTLTAAFFVGTLLKLFMSRILGDA